MPMYVSITGDASFFGFHSGYVLSIGMSPTTTNKWHSHEQAYNASKWIHFIALQLWRHAQSAGTTAKLLPLPVDVQWSRLYTVCPLLFVTRQENTIPVSQ